MNNKKTQKVKNRVDKKKIWKMFDEDMNINKEKKLELLFTEQSVQQRDICELCNSSYKFHRRNF